MSDVLKLVESLRTPTDETRIALGFPTLYADMVPDIDPAEFTEGRTTSELFDLRDAGRYAELLTAFYDEHTRPGWEEVLADEMANGAHYRKYLRSRDKHAFKFSMPNQPNRVQASDSRERLYEKRAFNPLLDTVEGHTDLVDAISTRAAELTSDDLPGLLAAIMIGKQAERTILQEHAGLIVVSVMGLMPPYQYFGAAYEGLVRAIQSYDPNLGYTFSTHAVKTIGGIVLNAATQERASFLGTNPTHYQKLRRVRNVERELASSYPKGVPDAVIAKIVRKNPEIVAEYRKEIAKQWYGPREYKERLLADFGHEDRETAQRLRELFAVVPKIIHLTEREQHTLFASLGIGQFKNAHSEAEIAEQLGISQNSVLRILGKTKTKIFKSRAANLLFYQYLQKESIAP